MTLRSLKAIAAATLLATALSAPVAAQTFPTKPVRIVVAFSAGTTSDIIARMFAERLTQSMGQPVIVENRTGAGGTIGAEHVAKAPADGYTLLLSTAALPVGKWVFRDLRFDAAKDFASVTVISLSPLALAANLDFPPRSIGELVTYAKANPGKISFGSAGVGTSHHLTGEKLKVDTGIDMQHVPYKGSGPAHIDLMGGQIQLMFDNIVALMPHFKAGKLRPLAVSSAKRHPLLPDVPSIAEAGVKDFEAVAWFGLLAPAGTPRDIVDRLNAETVKVIAIPAVRQRLLDAGSEIVGSSPEAADRHLQADIARWGAVVKAANIKAD